MRNSLNAQLVKAARKALCAALALSVGLAAAAPAYATDFSFNFLDPNFGNATNGQTSSVADNQVSNSNPPSFSTATFTRTVGGTPLALQMSAWSIDTDLNPDKSFNAVMKFWAGGGIGILNDHEAAQINGETSTSPDHAIDNDNGNVDFLVLQFSKPVNLASINLGWISNDSDVTIRWGNAPGAWNALPAIDDVAVTAANGLNSMVNTPGKTFSGGTTTGTRPTPNGALSDFWIISAANPNVVEGYKKKSDFFKLSAIVISEFPPLPEPGTWMTMIFGFGAIGGMMRRRRKFAITSNNLAVA